MRDHRRLSTTKPSALQRIEKIHPHLLLGYLGVFGVCLLFLFFFIIYGHSYLRLPEHIQYRVPKSFIFSTLAILLSSFFLYKAIGTFETHDVRKVAKELFFAWLNGIVFMVFQGFGWFQLQQSGVLLSPEYATGSFLYVLPGLHLLHVVGGLCYLGWLSVRTFNIALDPVKSLIMVTNPYEKIRFQIISVYWHAMDVLWIVMFVLFVLSL